MVSGHVIFSGYNNVIFWLICFHTFLISHFACSFKQSCPPVFALISLCEPLKPYRDARDTNSPLEWNSMN